MKKKNTATVNLWDSMKANFIGTFIALEAYIKKEEIVKMVSDLTVKYLNHFLKYYLFVLNN